eukprot:CAMPEP_0204288432 /NCGR_PEP_ID=MMETSP0468-20130131/56737_1 /ASSEMBLY_ACC=CAM_ASM_000383 /TAXON_ID=2969 /ORGANISM="Oxyrrhis marina" /LENGTH=66 /DNA_ID=CAMNT_0051266527 /DNA_START=132 /DNA_END=332 /DNA_ORIENTATION=+
MSSGLPLLHVRYQLSDSGWQRIQLTQPVLQLDKPILDVKRVNNLALYRRQLLRKRLHSGHDIVASL